MKKTKSVMTFFLGTNLNFSSGFKKIVYTGIIVSISFLFTTKVYSQQSLIVETIQGDGAGQISSVVLDNDGYAHISFFDDGDNTLKYAHWNGSNWQIETVDDSLNSGVWNSIDLDSQENPHIVYYNAQYDRLKYAYWDGLSWNIDSFESEGDVGIYCQIVLDSDDTPHITYLNSGATTLYYGTVSSNVWQFTSLATGNFRFPAIDVDSFDHPHVSFGDYVTGSLRYAYWNGIMWNYETIETDDWIDKTAISIDLNSDPHIAYGRYGGRNGLRYASKTNGTWALDIIDAEAKIDGYPSIKIDYHGFAHISYNNGGELKYAYQDSLEWYLQVVENAVLNVNDTSLDIDCMSKAYISFFDNGSGGILKFARPTSYGPDPFNLVSPSNGSITTNTPSFKWELSSYQGNGINNYELHIDGSFVKTIPATRCATTIDNPLNGGTHTWSIRAVLVEGGEIWSDETWSIEIDDTEPQNDEIKIIPDDLAEGDYFGVDVAISGEFVIIGSPFDDDKGSNSGSAYIYRLVDNSWIFHQKINASDGAADDNFGVSVDIDGDYIVVGARSDDDSETDAGSAYIFYLNGESWAEQSKLIPSYWEGNGWFGRDVSISGDFVIIGTDYTTQLAAFVFQRSDTTWIEQSMLVSSSGYPSNGFGRNVSLSNNYILIPEATAWDQGSIAVFQSISGTWMEQDRILNQNSGIIDLKDVNSIAGNHIDNIFTGSAVVYYNSDNTWTIQDTLYADDGQEQDEFGFRVSIYNDYAIVTAWRDDDKGTDAGAAYIFHFNGLEWNQIDKITPYDGYSDQKFGSSVAITNQHAIVGAQHDNEKGADAGAVYIYEGFSPDNPQDIIVSFYSSYGNSTRSLPSDISTPVKICADGSQATTVQVETNGNAENLNIRIVEGSSEHEYGSFRNEIQSPNVVLFHYTHPRIMSSEFQYRDVMLEIYDNSTNIVYETRPLRIYRAPVTLIHGLWANKDTFDDMFAELVKLWPSELVNPIDYETTNDHHLSINQQIIASGIHTGILNMRRDNFSVAKTNVVTHSMGGLLTRLYLQSEIYSDDICRFIPLNGPHSGSQMANLLLDLPPWIGIILATTGRDPYNGAVKDMQVDYDIIDNELNGSLDEDHIVPTHTISTNYNNLLPVNDSWDVFLVRLVARALGINIEFLTGILFNFDNHDLIVAEESQIGGVETYSNEFNDQKHHGSAANWDIISKVIQLLNTDFFDVSTYSNSGFNPPDLFYIFPQAKNQLAVNTSANDSINIIFPTTDETVVAGQNLNVEVIFTENIKEIYLAAGNSSIDVYWEAKNASSSSESFIFEVPEQAFGQYGIVTMGFNDSTFAALDTVHVSVSTPSLLDSISINLDTVHVYSGGGIAAITIYGHFNDGINRRLSNHSDLTLQIADPLVANVEWPGIITGHIADTTQLTAMFQEELTMATVVVLPDSMLTGFYDENDDDRRNNLPAIPKSYSLQQNYPNPFNPLTNIKFSIPKSEHVKIQIYNTLGQKIKTLVNKKIPAGIHEIEFNAESLPSAIYFYRIQAGEFQEVKKMLLIK